MSLPLLGRAGAASGPRLFCTHCSFDEATGLRAVLNPLGSLLHAAALFADPLAQTIQRGPFLLGHDVGDWLLVTLPFRLGVAAAVAAGTVVAAVHQAVVRHLGIHWVRRGLGDEPLVRR